MNYYPQFNVLVANNTPCSINEVYNTLTPHYKAVFAKTGQATLKQAKEAKPDLILLDLTLSDMNAFDVLSMLKESDVTRSIPVIITAKLNEAENEERALRFGAVDYITKPFHIKIIKARIEMHIKMAKLLHKKYRDSLMLKSKMEVRNIFFDEIMYVDILGKWLSFHLDSSEIVNIYAPLKRYSNLLLADPRFAYSHKSFILNMNFVKVIQGRSVLMQNSESLPISKRYMDFKKRYLEWTDAH